MKPHEIEQQSFDIIDSEAGDHGFSEEAWSVVRRMIHTTADFEYIDSVCISPMAIEEGVQSIRSGKNVITDTNMVKAGIRGREIEKFGGSVQCFITEPSLAALAESRGITRAKAAVDAAVKEMEGGIYVIGNAPTALLRLLELMETYQANPALVIGLPVGFVNAAESKALLCDSTFNHISNQGRKGGSNLAASVVNALIVLATGRQAYETDKG